MPATEIVYRHVNSNESKCKTRVCTCNLKGPQSLPCSRESNLSKQEKQDKNGNMYYNIECKEWANAITVVAS